MAIVATVAVTIAGCSRHRPPAPAAGSSAGAPRQASAAFRASVRVLEDGKTRKLKVRVYAAPPDSFRIEGSGPVGGIAVIATGNAGRVRIVVPSRRVHFEGALTDDLGSALLGLPLEGCDLLHAILMAGGLEGRQGLLQPVPQCSKTAGIPPILNVAEKDGAQLLEYTSRGGRIEIDLGRGPTAAAAEAIPLPKEVRIMVDLDTTPRAVLSDLRPLPWPGVISEGFFWEPLPEGSRHVTAADAAPEPEP